MLAGCRDDSLNVDLPEYVFVPEVVSLPSELTDVRNLTYFDGELYFWSMILLDREKYTYDIKLYSMNADGTDIAPLPNYKLPENPHLNTYPDSEGNFHIMSLSIDNEGYLWIAEMGSFYRFDLPDNFDGDDMEKYDYIVHLGEVMNIRRLDNTGAEVRTLDVSSLSAGAEWFYVSTFQVDSDGNLYLGTGNGDIFVLNNIGETLFKISVGNWIDQLVRMYDGSIAYMGWVEGGDRGYSQVLRKIDVAARDWGADVDLPENAWNIYPGGDEFTFLYRDGSNLNGFDSETGESVRILNWLESNIVGDNLDNIIILDDGRIICTNSQWNRITDENMFELNILTKTRYSDLPKRTILTLSTVWLDQQIRNYIVQFNRTNQNYRIHVIDYSEFNTEDEWNAGITRLSTDIIAGNVPDILDLSQLPFTQYVARGLLEDIYPLIDSDPNLNRSDLMEAVLRASELNGGLYQVFPSFGINTLVGHPRVVGPGIGWTMNEFKAVLEANPQADMPLGQWVTKQGFLTSAIYVNMDSYINWATGEVSFDTGEFAKLLEFANRFPEDQDSGGDMGVYLEESDLIATGRQIMSNVGVWDFRTIQMYSAMYGGEVAFKGFPTDSGNGNSLTIGSGLGITTRASNKDGAWEFVSGILSSQWQDENVSWMFPVNKTSFNNMAQRALEDDSSHEIGWGRGPGMSVMLKPVTQADIDLIVNLIETTYGISNYDEALMNIINENAQDFFSGRTSAQDTARIIQSRVSIFVSEQS